MFANRNGTYNKENYDIVFGPVANDTIYRTFIAYEEGILTRDETIARLKVKKLFDQMTFTSDPVLKELKYIGQFNAWRDQNRLNEHQSNAGVYHSAPDSDVDGEAFTDRK